MSQVLRARFLRGSDRRERRGRRRHPRAACAPAIGIDLVSVREIERSIDHFGERYLRRLFTDDEIAYAMSTPARAAERLAARFAAKEAVRKALGSHADGAPWRQIEVRRTPAGSPEILLHGAAREAAQAAGISALAVSLSHESDYAVALVAAARERDER